MVENRSVHPAELRPSRDLGREGFGSRSPLSGPRRHFGPGLSSKTYRGESGLRSPRAAREVVRGMELPRDREIMSHMSWEDIVNQSLVTVVRVSCLTRAEVVRPSFFFSSFRLFILTNLLFDSLQHANEIIQLHDMLRASEHHRQKSRASQAELEKLMDSMSANLKKAQEAHRASEAAEQESKRISERALRNEEEAKAEVVAVR